MKWINAGDRLPVAPDGYALNWNDESEPPIVFLNRTHSATFVTYLSWIRDQHESLHKRLNGDWPIVTWEWLDQTPSTVTEEEIQKGADDYVKAQGSHDRPDITKHDFIAGAKFALSSGSGETEQKQEDLIEISEELWDKHSEHIDDDLSSLEQVAGSSVLSRRDYDKLILELKQSFNITRK
jgi:hypothetical protein